MIKWKKWKKKNETNEQERMKEKKYIQKVIKPHRSSFPVATQDTPSSKHSVARSKWWWRCARVSRLRQISRWKKKGWVSLTLWWVVTAATLYCARVSRLNNREEEGWGRRCARVWRWKKKHGCEGGVSGQWWRWRRRSVTRVKMEEEGWGGQRLSLNCVKVSTRAVLWLCVVSCEWLRVSISEWMNRRSGEPLFSYAVTIAIGSVICEIFWTKSNSTVATQSKLRSQTWSPVNCH